MPGENQCRIGVAALLDPAYSFKSRRLPLRTTNRQAHSLSDRLGLRGMTPSHGPVYRFDGLFRPRAVGGQFAAVPVDPHGAETRTLGAGYVRRRIADVDDLGRLQVETCLLYTSDAADDAMNV